MSITNLAEPEPDSSYKQVRLALWHPGCWTLAVTDEHDGTHLIEKSLYTADDVIKGDFVLVARGQAVVDDVVETIDGNEVVHDVAVLKRSDGRARIVVNYERESSIVPEIVNSDFMPIEPVHITDGREHWTVLVRACVLSDVIAEMEDEYDVEMSAVQEVDPKESVAFADVVDRIHDDLSARQRELMFEACEAGYYNWPREVAASDVAEGADISASTFLEHIRRGEQKILQSVFEELEHRHPRT
jgi:predicted DNA binding protein